MHALLVAGYRSTGQLYGGQLNVTYMGSAFQLSSGKQLLNIFYEDATIIRRLNVHGISIRTMVVVSVEKKRQVEQKKKAQSTSHLHKSPIKQHIRMHTFHIEKCTHAIFLNSL